MARAYFKEIWHKVTSTPIFDKSGEMISAVEASWPVDVQDVFAVIAPEILGEKDADVVREKIIEGVLMLGFDSARLYWVDPNTGLLIGKVWAGPGYDPPSKLSELGIVFTRDAPGADALKPVQQGKISLIRRKSLNSDDIPKISEEDVRVFWLDPLPYEEQLQHQGVPELLIVPLVSASGIMGAIAADYKLSKQFIADNDIRGLRQYAWLAAQFIQVAEYGSHLADLLRRLSHQTLTPLQAIRFQLDVMRSSSEEEREAAYESVSQTIGRLANTYSVHSRFVKLSSLPEYDELLRKTVSENLERVKVKSLFEEQKKLFKPLCRMEDIDFRIGNTKSNGHEVTIDVHKDIFFNACSIGWCSNWFNCYRPK